MKSFNKNELYQELLAMNAGMLEAISVFESVPFEDLQLKPDNDKWSVLECMEHLNRYAAFYNPEIKRVLGVYKKTKTNHFKSSWLGNYFAHSVAPKKKLNKMKTFTVMNPVNSNLDQSAMFRLKMYLKEMEVLLEESIDYDWNKVKTNISISKLIKLRLGDTWRVVIYHNQRHFNQMFQVFKDLGIQSNLYIKQEGQD